MTPCRAGYELLDYNPVANSDAVFVSEDGWARFTVLSSRLLRLEYASAAWQFEDRPTVPIVNRYFAAVPAGTELVVSNASLLVLQTSELELRYAVGSGPFTAANVAVTSRNASGGFSRWDGGMTNSNSDNLLGTIRSLDLVGVVPLNCTENADIRIHDESLHCAWGVVGRQGFAVVDDSASWTLNSTTFWWSDSANVDAQDWYLFAHGLDYTGALGDFVQVAGRIAMPPRYAVGVMYTRWFNYDSSDLRRIVEAYASRSLPLDVLVLDMDWHTKFGWGTYTMDERLFQYPADALQWVQAQGVAVALNLHDDNGVIAADKMYAPFAASLGLDPQSTATIPFSIVNASYMYNLDDVVLGDLRAMGVDFWWIDWQQGGTAGGATGDNGLSQNPTYMLNHVRGTDSMRNGGVERDMVLGRFGGLGNHRYPVGFSGDVLGARSLPAEGLTWRNLAFQPYFSWTASNVAYGFWSHDLVGPRYDHELHTRWLQWGANSAVFRTHDRGMSSGYCAQIDEELCAVVRVYNVPLRFFEVNRAAMLRRTALTPYLYQQYRVAYDTGVSVLRPMYYAYAQYQRAYAGTPDGHFAQYLLGDQLLVAPVVTPSDAATGTAAKSVWLPPGVWYEYDTGMLFGGGADAVLTKSYDLSEVPTFVRAGAVLPSLPLHRLAGDLNGVARRQYTALRFAVYPGALSGSYQLYEDDGATTAYTAAAYVTTTLTYAYASADTTLLKLAIDSVGSYAGFPASRDYELLVANAPPPSRVTLNGNVTIRYARRLDSSASSSGYWTYLGDEVSLLVVLPTLPTDAPVQLVVEFDADVMAATRQALVGLKGAFLHGALAKQHLDQAGVTPGTHATAGGYLDLVCSSADALSYLAGHANLSAFVQRVVHFAELYARAVDEVAALHAYVNGTLLQLYSQAGQDSLLCASAACVRHDQPLKYYQLRVEGYLPPSSSADSQSLVALRSYYNSAVHDHLVTTDGQSLPAGYRLQTELPPAYVYSSPAAGRLPLSLWYHPLRQDHLTVASAAGVDFANYWGYQLVNASVGYVLSQPPAARSSREYVPPERQSYAVSVLSNVFVAQPWH